MRKSLRASVLVLALALSAQAGEIPCPPVAPPPSAVAEQPTDGIIECQLTEMAISLLGSVLALF